MHMASDIKNDLNYSAPESAFHFSTIDSKLPGCLIRLLRCYVVFDTFFSQCVLVPQRPRIYHITLQRPVCTPSGGISNQSYGLDSTIPQSHGSQPSGLQAPPSSATSSPYRLIRPRGCSKGHNVKPTYSMLDRPTTSMVF